MFGSPRAAPADGRECTGPAGIFLQQQTMPSKATEKRIAGPGRGKQTHDSHESVTLLSHPGHRSKAQPGRERLRQRGHGPSPA